MSLNKWKFHALIIATLANLPACSMFLNVSKVAHHAERVDVKVPRLFVESSHATPTAYFDADPLNLSHLECRIVGAIETWTTCTSPFDLTALTERGFEGIFEVRGVSTSGHAGPIATRLFRRGYLGLFNVFTKTSPNVTGIAETDDGGRLLGGTFDILKPEVTLFATSLNEDASYHPILEYFNGNINTFAFQPDGKILIGGNFTAYGGNEASPDRFIRLNTDGSEDTSFSANFGQGFNNQVNKILVQSDGRILVAGLFTAYHNGTSNLSRGAIVRLNADGTEDSAFATASGLGFNNSINSLGLLSDGSIIVAGVFTHYNNQSATPNYIAKLDSNGNENLIFRGNAGAGFDSGAIALVIQPDDDQIVVGGQFSSYAGAGATPDRIVRLNSDGVEDTTFRANVGTGFNNNFVLGLALQNDGKILLCGDFTSFAGNPAAPDRIFRLNANGSADTAFNTAVGVGVNDYIRSFAVQEDGKILVGGWFTMLNNIDVPNYFFRLNEDGSLDNDYNAPLDAGVGDYVTTVAIRDDKKVFLGGYLSHYPGNSHGPKNLAKFAADGSLNAAFNSNLGSGFDAILTDLSLQKDQKILVSGDFTSLNGAAGVPDRLLRLNGDGTLDASFNANLGTGFDALTSSVAIQDDEKILVGGDFTSFNTDPTAPNRLFRLNSDGTPDTAFNANLGTGFDIFTTDISLQTDGKILVSGNFASFNGNGTIPGRLLRFNNDGTLDTAFNTNLGTGFDAMTTKIVIQTDGKILVSGNFTSFNGSTAAPDRLFRLNSDGTPDTAFNTAIGTGFNASTTSLAVQADGKILVGGDFTSFDGDATLADRFLRLNNDGTPDSAFNAKLGTGFDQAVNVIFLKDLHTIQVGGNFTFFKTIPTFLNWEMLQ